MQGPVQTEGCFFPTNQDTQFPFNPSLESWIVSCKKKQFSRQLELHVMANWSLLQGFRNQEVLDCVPRVSGRWTYKHNTTSGVWDCP